MGLAPLSEEKKVFFFLNEKFLLFLVFITGLSLRIYMALVDPMLHDWDERFHALVAKNMMKEPFRPMLYTHQYFTTEWHNWTYNHIWLHKQPLFLWQMALSMKVFGVSEISIRIPSILMGALMILLVYRVSFLATRNKWTSLFAATLIAFNNYYLILTSGREGMDHNDIAFAFYLLASFWAYAEYLHKPLKKWVILIGVFAGCAILNKWLTGLIVFAPWGIQALTDLFRSGKWTTTLHMLLALLVCTVVFLPWQLYILHAFNREAVYEYAYNARHIREVVEGHGGDIWAYLNMFPYYFGWNVNYLVPIGFIVLLTRKDILPGYKIMLTVAPVVVFCFFSFLVQTKMKAYFFMVAPLCIVLEGIAFYWLLSLFGRFKVWVAPVLVIICICYVLDWKQISDYTHEINYRQSKIYNTELYKKIDRFVPEDIDVVLNCNNMEHVDLMFYSKRLEAYHSQIRESEFREVTKNGKRIAVFPERYNYPLPDFIRNYEHLYIIPLELK